MEMLEMKADSCLILPVISHYIPNSVLHHLALQQPSQLPTFHQAIRSSPFTSSFPLPLWNQYTPPTDAAPQASNTSPYPAPPLNSLHPVQISWPMILNIPSLSLGSNSFVADGLARLKTRVQVREGEEESTEMVWRTP
jgi:hypothetical protein